MTALPNADRVPSELFDFDQWVCWKSEDRGEKQTKVPIDPSTGQYASTTRPETWAGFETARAYGRETSSIAGLGFVFSDDDPFVGIDLDDCREDDGDAVAEWATDIIERLDSYTEISPSGTGYHVIVRGSLPDGPNRRGDVECYETARYFTMTGDSEHDPPRPIAERSVELAAVHADYLSDDERDDSDENGAADIGGQGAGSSSTGLDDEAVLEKATSAKNSAKFERLWNGSTGGYDSHSEADMALCFHLAFWTGGDTAQIDRLFRRSGLMRAKWDEVHFADGSTYGEKTVERAVQRADEFYDPPETGDQKESPAEDSAVTPRKQPNSVPRPQAPPSHGSGASPTLTGADHRLFDLVDRLEARVEQLEAENEALRAQLADARREKDPFEQETGSEETTQSTGTRSVWDRIVSRIGSSNE